MALPNTVVTALNNLSARLTAATLSGGVKPYAVTGALSWNGAGPKITLSASIDPKDMVRASGTYTVDETTSGLSVLRRVFTFDLVLGVAADGITLPMPNVLPRHAAHSVSGGSHTHTVIGCCTWFQYSNSPTSNAASSISATTDAPSTSYSLVSSTITLLTRFH